MNGKFKRILNETLKEWKYAIKVLGEEKLGRKLIIERDRLAKLWMAKKAKVLETSEMGSLPQLRPFKREKHDRFD